jgi:hypothetical protein
VRSDGPPTQFYGAKLCGKEELGAIGVLAQQGGEVIAGVDEPGYAQVRGQLVAVTALV